MTKQCRPILLIGSLLILITGSAFSPAPQKSQQPVVQAVMFWMEGCLHCHDVIENVLPPIQEKYGDQFQIVLIELKSSQEVTALYTLANNMGIPQNDVGVPFLIIGEHVLVGSGEIPEHLPDLIESYLAAGGVDFPDSPALAPLLPKEGLDTPLAGETGSLPTPTLATPNNTLSEPSAPVSAQSFQGNNGFIFAWLTIFLLFGTLVLSAIYMRQNTEWLALTAPPSKPELVNWLVPLLAIIGLGVAAYQAYVETQAVRAFCGPIGDCNTVQSSPYARLFGILPIGVLGVFGYILILLAWAVKHYGRAPWSNWASLAMLVMTFGGTLFSVYLTYLEVAVIRAVCMWCVSSALIMAGLLLLSVPSGMPKPKSLSDL